MHYIIFDLEATCWDRATTTERKPNEIIEIGAVCINAEKEIVGEFSAFVQPILHRQLSDFCTQLTTIRQEEVDQAEKFPEVVAKFQAWIGSFDTEFALCSWGNYDKGQLRHDCLLHQLPIDWLETHISIKHQYGKIRRSIGLTGMEKALKAEGFTLEGTHHRGIDDARNIAKIFLKYFDSWKYKWL